VPKVQFLFKVVDARIDAPASHKQGLETRFSSSIQRRASSSDTSFDTDKQVSTIRVAGTSFTNVIYTKLSTFPSSKIS